jgi:hypothetical protein
MITHVMFVSDQHGFASINHTTSNYSCQMHCSEHWSHSSLGCYCHLWTGMFGITFLIYFTTKFCFGTLLASLKLDLLQCEIYGSVLQRVDNIPCRMCSKWLTSFAERKNHKWQSETNNCIFCLVTFFFYIKKNQDFGEILAVLSIIL